MIRRTLIMLLGVGLLMGAVVGFQMLKTKLIARALADYAAQPQTVASATVAYADWVPQEHAVGTLRAVRGVDVAAEVAGIVDRISFTSGSEVAAGTPLVRLRADTDPARLAQLQAAAALAAANLDRDTRQYRAQAVSQAQLDTSRSNLKSAQAELDAQQALIDEKDIRAPFAGRLGLRRVDLGQFIGPGTVIVSLQALDPIYLDFLLPQQALGTVTVGQAVTAAVDAFPGHAFAGTITAVDAAVDTATRNIRVRARIANPDHRLLPGMYATLTITTGAARRLLTVPQTAINFNPYGSTVFVLKRTGETAGGKPVIVAQETFVKTGEVRGDRIAILGGLTQGEEVASVGLIKLHNGTHVVIDNSVPPDAGSNGEPNAAGAAQP